MISAAKFYAVISAAKVYAVISAAKVYAMISAARDQLETVSMQFGHFLHFWPVFTQ